MHIDYRKADGIDGQADGREGEQAGGRGQVDGRTSGRRRAGGGQTGW